MTTPPILILIGLIVGIYSGILGLGGGTIMVPVMIFLLAFDPRQAIGTSLAIMIPALIPAVIRHYHNGNVKLGMALWIAIGMAAGGLVGAEILKHLPANLVRLIFGFVVVFVAAYTIYGKQHMVRALFLSAIVTLVAIALHVGANWYDRHHPSAPISSTARLPLEEV